VTDIDDDDDDDDAVNVAAQGLSSARLYASFTVSRVCIGQSQAARGRLLKCSTGAVRFELRC